MKNISRNQGQQKYLEIFNTNTEKNYTNNPANETHIPGPKDFTERISLSYRVLSQWRKTSRKALRTNRR